MINGTTRRTEARGVFRGGHWAVAPPLGRQDSVISVEYYAKLRHAHPPFVSWAVALSTQRVGEDVCFWPAPNFGQKSD